MVQKHFTILLPLSDLPNFRVGILVGAGGLPQKHSTILQL
jgi:hypothetical protein